MNALIEKLVKYLRNSAYHFLIDHNPDILLKSITISHPVPSSNIEWYIQIATIDWSSGKIVLNFTPSASESDKNILTNLIKTFDQNK